MKAKTFAFNLIVRDNEDCIIECLNSTLVANADEYVFCDTGSKDKTLKLITKWGKDNNKTVKIYHFKDFYGYDWTDDNQEDYDFGAARQIALKNTTTDYIVWIDSDDILENAERIPSLVQSMAAQQPELHQLIMPYRYGVDEYGNDIVYHFRERIIRNLPNIKWVGRVHEHIDWEGIVPQSMAREDVKWRHQRKPEHVKRTNRRNKLIMMKEYKELQTQKMRKPMRLLQNIGYDAFEHQEWDIACKYYSEYYAAYMDSTASSNERAQNQLGLNYSLLNWARCEIARKNYDKAEELINKVKYEDETDKQLYVLLSQIRLMQNRLDSAQLYLDLASKTKIKPSLLPINHVGIAVDEIMIAVDILKFSGEYEKAIEKLTEAYIYTPNNPRISMMIEELEEQIILKQSFEGFLNIKSSLASEGNIEGLKSLMKATSSQLAMQEGIQVAVKDVGEYISSVDKALGAKLPDKKYIVIFTGPAFEKWAGDSRKGGIGGSEEMVIGMASHLSKLGNKVKVVNDCQDLAGEYDGVEYVDFRNYEPDSPDVVIVSRMPSMFYKQTQTGLMPVRLFGAKRQYLWLHDTSYRGSFPMGFNNVDGVFVLTDFHREVIHNAHQVIPEKMWVTRNGIEVDHYLKLIEGESIERDPNQLIYCSSYDRGLLEFLQIFKKIKAEIPEAKAKVYYGWNTYDARMKQMPENFSDHPTGLSMRQYRDTVTKLMEETGVKDGGRIGQDELFLEMCRSNIWLYPTWFSEISCITAMRAQLAGTIPVVTPVAALNETVKSGVKNTDFDVLTKECIDIMRDEKRAQSMRKEAIEVGKQYSLSELAKEWDKFIGTVL